MELVEVRQGPEGIIGYAKVGGWKDGMALIEEFALWGPEPLRHWYEVGEDFVEISEAAILRRFRGKVGFNVDRRWYVEEAELLELADGRFAISLEEHERIS